MPPKKTDPHSLSAGDEVSWKWGQGHPTGDVKDVVDGKAEVTTKRGNKISKEGSKDDPAVVLNTGQSDAVKKVGLRAGRELTALRMPKRALLRTFD